MRARRMVALGAMVIVSLVALSGCQACCRNPAWWWEPCGCGCAPCGDPCNNCDTRG